MLARRARAQVLDVQVPEYWMSYSDLMAGVMMMFILMLILSMQQLGSIVEEQIGVSADIVTALQQKFATKGTSALNIQVDPSTGAIVISDGIFFDYNSAKLSVEGRRTLQAIFPVYEEVLLGEPQFKSNLAELIVEGHTDHDGSYLSNLSLSQQRANAVVEFLLGNEYKSPYKAELQGFLTANGRSEARPVADNSTDAGKAKNRRIEFKFRLKDEEALERLADLLKGAQ